MNYSKLWFIVSQSKKTKILPIAISILLFVGIYLIAFAIQQSTTVLAQGQSADTISTIPLNAAEVNSTFANTTQPVEGYGGPPTGPLNAVRHVFDDPTLRVYHFCKLNDKIMMVCQLYDSSSPNATLVGVEYMIDAKTYKSLPDREKPNWHNHKEEFSPERANPKFPLLSDQQQKNWLIKLSESYGKVILNWNPMDTLPVFPPQIEQVQHPFMLNQTVNSSNEKHVGSFNQTLNY